MGELEAQGRPKDREPWSWSLEAVVCKSVLHLAGLVPQVQGSLVLQDSLKLTRCRRFEAVCRLQLIPAWESLSIERKSVAGTHRD